LLLNIRPYIENNNDIKNYNALVPACLKMFDLTVLLLAVGHGNTVANVDKFFIYFSE
jgi:hypothetical protein